MLPAEAVIPLLFFKGLEEKRITISTMNTLTGILAERIFTMPTVEYIILSNSCLFLFWFYTGNPLSAVRTYFGIGNDLFTANRTLLSFLLESLWIPTIHRNACISWLLLESLRRSRGISLSHSYCWLICLNVQISVNNPSKPNRKVFVLTPFLLDIENIFSLG
jgi:hypothetical protein